VRLGVDRSGPGPCGDYFPEDMVLPPSDPSLPGRTARTDLETAIFEASPNAYVVVDRELRCVTANAAYLRVTHSRLEDLKGRVLVEAFPHDPDNPANEQALRLATSLRAVIESGEPDVLPLIRYQIATERGLEERFWSATHTPLFDAQGRVAFVLQHTVDVTDLRHGGASFDEPSQDLERAGVLQRAGMVQAENRQLDNKVRELYGLFEQAPGFMCFLRGPELVFELANAAYYQLVGHRDILGKPLREALPELAGQEFVVNLEQVACSGQSFVGRGVRVSLQKSKDAPPRERVVDFVYQPVLDARREIAGVMVLGFDITQQKAVEEALRRSQERLRTLVEASGAGTFEMDATGGIRLDERARALLGVELDVLPDLEAAVSLVHPEDRAGTEEALRRALDPAGNGRYFHEYRTKTRAGAAPHWIEVRGQAFFSAGRPSRFAGTLLDTTERKRREVEILRLLRAQRQAERERVVLLEKERKAREEAEKANFLKDEFLAAVSHELRTPLTAMLGWLQLLRNNTLPPEKAARAMEIIERNSKAQAKLIEDLLDVGRIVSGKLELEHEPVDMTSVANSAVENVRPLSDARNVSVELRTSLAADCVVLGDAKRLQQVVWNLLTNAVKFTPEGGKVLVSVESRDRGVEVCVEDSGIGIDAQFLPHVFERFRQAEGGTARKMGGLGLGLSIVRHLVEAHQGSVQAHSDGLEKGSRFVVRMPAHTLAAADASALRASESEHGVTSSDLDGMHVLVVDDEADTREYVRTLLERASARVSEATSAGEALSLLRAHHPDLLVSDIGMAGVDGNSLIRQVRELSSAEGGNTPAVALTAHAREADRKLSIQAGFQRYVTKPVEPEDLLSALRALRRGDRRRRVS
jgi:PAS domain S-box-containing protein